MLLLIINESPSSCSWWMFPLLIISWLLGAWFWSLFKGSDLRERISKLEARVAGLNTQVIDLKSDLNTLTSENEILASSNSKLIAKIDTIDATKTALENELLTLKEKYPEE